MQKELLRIISNQNIYISSNLSTRYKTDLVDRTMKQYQLLLTFYLVINHFILSFCDELHTDTATFTLTPDSPSSTYGNVSIIQNNNYNDIYYNSTSGVSSWRCNGNSTKASWCIDLKLFTPGIGIYSVNLTLTGKPQSTGESDIFTTFATSENYFTVGNDWDGNLHGGDSLYNGGVLTAPACSNAYDDTYNYTGIYSFVTGKNIYDLLSGPTFNLTSGESIWSPFRNAIAGGSLTNFRSLESNDKNGRTSPVNLAIVNDFEENEIKVSFESPTVDYSSCILNNTSFGRTNMMNVMITSDHDVEKWEMYSIDVILTWS